MAPRLSAQRQQDRAIKGKRKAGGRTEGRRGVTGCCNNRGMRSRTRVQREERLSKKQRQRGINNREEVFIIFIFLALAL